uniref:Uncharacterized protein n=1 Tax=Romanomermis culicivorax TaxID=13658 RepID=A0A915IUZ3_ROMCU
MGVDDVQLQFDLVVALQTAIFANANVGVTVRRRSREKLLLMEFSTDSLKDEKKCVEMIIILIRHCLVR